MNRKVKLVVIALLVALALVLVFQNIQQVETRILFARVSMPLAGTLAVCLALGFAVGWLVAKRPWRGL